MKKNPMTSFFVMTFFVVMTRDVHAYLDPGTGSALLQGLIAAFATLVITAKLYWYRILRFLGIGKKDGGAPSNNESNKTDESNTTDGNKQ